VIVSGGRGLKGPEHFDIVEALAKGSLGRRLAPRGRSSTRGLAGTRRPGRADRQDGLAKLYVAIAISGAIQHLAGMSSSRCIVAINKDADV
jgi:electron transfer flavoprotein alpha subunit